MVFDRLLWAAMVVGVIAGLLYTGVQHVQVIPIIQIAEGYENNPGGGTAADAQHNHDAHAQDEHGHHTHQGGSWEPANGLERTTFTLLTNTLTSIGLAMVLITLIVATRSRSDLREINWRQGLFWALAGYLAFFVAPSLGLPPELPGAAAAPLEDRQIWWMLAVASTSIALLAVAFLKSPWRWIALLLIVVPHVVGAPHLGPGEPMFPTEEAAAAAELIQLAKKFVGATAIANGFLWLILGLASVWSIRRFVVPVDMQSLAEKSHS